MSRAALAAAAALLLPLTGCATVADGLDAALTTPPTSTPAGPLRIAVPHDDGTYDRDAFGSGWADLDHDGCETRDEILARDMTDVVTDDGCDVKAGTLADPYTGRSIDFTDAAYWTVHIDHIYPLHRAWIMGADEWTDQQREVFANDPRNLLAVDAHTNMSKGDSGPGEWVPLNRAYARTYARKYTQVARLYDLPVTQADADSLADLRETC